MKKYSNLYNEIKNMITSKQLLCGDKIPSVRKAAEIYGVSTTTVQNAYFELCADGYIIAQPKSGYFVSDINEIITREEIVLEKPKIKYDLTGGVADADSFDFTLWQRYIKSALRQRDRLLSYSEPQGEYDLRCAISGYIRDKRNVVASPDRIVIGAGVQPLLQALCSLLRDKRVVSFPDKSFVQGMGIFADNGFEVHTRDKDADIIYVSPSHMTRWGDVMPIKRRLELINYSVKNNSLVIEDDYENDFLYNVKPTPSLYALGKGNIIYIGSFSAMLLPGIRISFMVLTEELEKAYRENCYRYAQTASKTEQIALCQYIRDGHINSQTRKIRRLYSAKAKEFSRLLKKEFPESFIEIGENTLQIIMKCHFEKDLSVFEENGLAVFVEKYENNELVLVISPSGISQKEFDKAAKALKKAIEY
ncbi:MAG: PLP-dependent aminotransferase family protein [Eubacteriales bacterium]|nr:PLP-dependent aminotransferase family protein [Eubacteriales bacterium]